MRGDGESRCEQEMKGRKARRNIGGREGGRKRERGGWEERKEGEGKGGREGGRKERDRDGGRGGNGGKEWEKMKE